MRSTSLGRLVLGLVAVTLASGCSAEVEAEGEAQAQAIHARSAYTYARFATTINADVSGATGTGWTQGYPATTTYPNTNFPAFSGNLTFRVRAHEVYTSDRFPMRVSLEVVYAAGTAADRAPKLTFSSMYSRRSTMDGGREVQPPEETGDNGQKRYACDTGGTPSVTDGRVVQTVRWSDTDALIGADQRSKQIDDADVLFDVKAPSGVSYQVYVTTSDTSSLSPSNCRL